MLKKKMKKNEFYLMARDAMVECQIRPDGVIREDVIAAFATLPREEYLPQEMRGVAYVDDQVSASKGHLLLAPSVHARMVEALNPQGDELTLDISVSDGYSAAILSPLVSTVVALDADENTDAMRNKLWEEHDALNIVALSGGLNKGDAEHAPFDLIFMHGGVAHIPETIVEQLKVGGRMVCLIKEAGAHIGKAVLLHKTSKDTYSCKTLFEASAAYLPSFSPTPTFVF